MVSVRINGNQSTITGESLPRLIDLVEVIKDHIDPGHMITALEVNGRPLADEEWELSPRHFGEATVEISTGTPGSYIADRIPMAPEIIDTCFLMFRETRKAFTEGNSEGGNELLQAAVNNFQAFVRWYRTMLELMPGDQRLRCSIDDEVRVMTPTLERICTQQLTQSWRATGDTIFRELEPQLDTLHSRLRSIISNEQRFLGA